MKPSNKNSQPKDSPLDKKTVAIGAIALLIAILWFRNHYASDRKPAVSLEKEKVSKTVSNEPQIIEPSKHTAQEKEAYNKSVMAARRDVYFRQQLGLKTLGLKAKDGRLQIPFDFVPQKLWCQGGDLDTMKYAASQLSSKEFLISLESIDGSKVKDSFYVSVEDLYKGLSHTFKVPSATSTRSLALSICMDKKKDGTCSNSQAMDQVVLTKALGTKKTPKQDQLFYFQNLILKKDQLETYRNNVFSKTFKKNLDKYLAEEDVSAEAAKHSWKSSQAIRSNGLEVTNGKIILSLPYNDPRCLPGNAH